MCLDHYGENLSLWVQKNFSDVPYLRSKDVFRYSVPEDKVRWSVEFPEYSPPDYTDPSSREKKWTDPDIKDGKFRWNSIDGKINRKSFIW